MKIPAGLKPGIWGAVIGGDRDGHYRLLVPRMDTAATTEQLAQDRRDVGGRGAGAVLRGKGAAGPGQDHARQISDRGILLLAQAIWVMKGRLGDAAPRKAVNDALARACLGQAARMKSADRQRRPARSREDSSSNAPGTEMNGSGHRDRPEDHQACRPRRVQTTSLSRYGCPFTGNYQLCGLDGRRAAARR